MINETQTRVILHYVNSFQNSTNLNSIRPCPLSFAYISNKRAHTYSFCHRNVLFLDHWNSLYSTRLKNVARFVFLKSNSNHNNVKTIRRVNSTILVIKKRQINLGRMDLRSGETTSCQSTLNPNNVFA